MNKAEKSKLWEFIETFFYYASALDNLILVAVGTLASVQPKVAEATAKAMLQLLDCCATHPSAVNGFISSDMIL